MTNRELCARLKEYRKALLKANEQLVAKGLEPVRPASTSKKIVDLPGQEKLFDDSP